MLCFSCLSSPVVIVYFCFFVRFGGNFKVEVGFDPLAKLTTWLSLRLGGPTPSGVDEA